MLTKRRFAKIRYSTFAFVGVFILSLILAGLSPSVTYASSEWDAKYWNNKTLSGDPVLHRSESHLDHDWGGGAPRGVNADKFSARWKRTVHLSTGMYRFTATMDDGLRLWVDDNLIIDSWWDSQVHSLSADIYLYNGDHKVKVEYYNTGGQAVAKLNWTQIQGAPTAIYNWRGEYFNNPWLSGTPVLVRDDQNINFDWGGGAPEWNVVAADEFSARWTRTLSLSPGRYRFVVRADDGVRLWVNGHRIINEWHSSSATFYSHEIDLPGGPIPIQMEYYEDHGAAVAQLSWERTAGTSFSYWRGEYFNNPWLSGSPAMIRDDASINFNWGYGSPSTTIPGDNYAVRWTRDLYFEAGTYQFTTTTDDGVRLWVNGRLLIDRWQDQSATSYANNIYLAGTVPIKMEYYENGGLASAHLSWTRVDGYTPPPAPITSGTVIVDDADSGFVQGGSATAWQTAAEGQYGQLTWTRNNDRMRANYNWGRWYPSLDARRYELFVYIPERYSTTGNARYWVSHRDGYTLRAVDQSANSGRWVSLGTFWFSGSGRDYVSLSDITFEPYISHLIAYDAVKWEPR
jgi:hypothetical protein